MWGRKVLTFVLVASLMMVGATGTVLADAEAGASGNCDPAEPEDGDDGEQGAAVLLSQDTQDLLTPGEIEGTLNGLAHLAQASVESGSPACEEGETSTDDDEQGDDYLEAHADNGEGQAVQVCIDEETTTGNGDPVLADGDDGQFEGTDHNDTNENRNCEYGQHQDETESPESPV